jgi:anti-anti-sigma regulatory factor
VIRINVYHDGSSISFIIEGTLAGEWAEEFEKCWQREMASESFKSITVNLSAVSFMDEKGRELLERLYKQGATLKARGVMTQSVIDEIKGMTE